MKTIESILKEEMKHLDGILNEVPKRIDGAPRGLLRISKKGKKVEYYYKTEKRQKRGNTGNRAGVENNYVNTDRGEYVENEINQKNTKEFSINDNGRYIKKEEINLAKQIAQRDYDLRILTKAKERRNAIEVFLNKYEETSLGKVYKRTSEHRKELISAWELSDDEYVKRWQNVEYKGKAFYEDTPEIYTEKGERVRSKSEKIIADKLNILGIPYRYEYPLLLEDSIVIYPDFTILRVATREEIYLEHFGMMDDSEYVDKVMNKINTYERNGLYLGVKIFCTHETKKNPLNVKILGDFLKNIFCVEEIEK